MALRVLLADESSTIKKVMQLALHDFAIEIKVVPVGLDVAQVAQSFHPDIIFVDVLLPKKNGYDVAQELKNHPETSDVPVVLMWSGFMDLDEAKFKAGKANGKLEKPFDADSLRSLVRHLVPKTSEQKISEFLTFPKLPDFAEAKPTDVKTPPPPESSVTHTKSIPGFAASAAQTTAGPDPLTMMALDPVPAEPDDFEAVRLQRLPSDTKNKPPEPEQKWQEQSLHEFRIDLPEVDLEEVTVSFTMPDESDINESDFLVMSPKGPKQLQKNSFSEQSASEPAEESHEPISASEMERIVREQIKETIETAVWRVLPDIAEKIIREEISKLLTDAEKKFYQKT